MINLAGAITYRAAVSFYFAMSPEQALYFNGIDIAIGFIAVKIFKYAFKWNEATSIIAAHAISSALGFAITVKLFGAFDPLAALILTVGSILIRTLLPKLSNLTADVM